MTARRTSTARRHRWTRELLLVAVLYLVYDSSRFLVRGDLQAARHNAARLLDAERWLHLSPELWLNTKFSRHPSLGVFGDFSYASLHYLVTPAVLIWLWRARPAVYRRARTWLALTTVFALAGFILYPVAPPRLMPSVYGFTDTMAAHAGIGWWSGDASAPKGVGSLTNQFAAMPSLHVGWALWCGLILVRHAQDPSVRTLRVLYPPMIAVVVMGTGNHYFADVLAGAAVTVLCAVLTGPLLRARDRLFPGNGAASALPPQPRRHPAADSAELPKAAIRGTPDRR
ncbi:phosphatase PAP2 family protein [Kitasatospora sp. MBT63]|uniref:phosphatase PAP2 family protein n=1 Tax=Kitasatospora sp. MBT63 TaxID=1444768 RepID=UPI000B095EF3|nr:phosphatase PAP2 family protein [Kitasatospora sp. MBT63]